MKFKVCNTALITPFTANGELDLDVLNMLRRQSELDVDGVVILGSTGESSTITHEERNLLIQTAVRVSAVPVIVGTGAAATISQSSIQRKQKSLGAHAVLISNALLQ